MTTIDVHGTKVGPTANSRAAIAKLSTLTPLQDVSAAMEALSRGRELVARKAVAQQESKQITDQLRAASRKRRSMGVSR